MTKTIGALIRNEVKRARAKKGWTRDDLAEVSKVDTRTIAALENGERANPRLRTVYRVLEGLGYSGTEIELLLEDDSQPSLARSVDGIEAQVSAAIYRRYDEQYSNLPLISLLNDHQLIENQLLSDVVYEVEEALARSGYVQAHGGFTKGDDLVLFSIESSTAQRGERVVLLVTRESGVQTSLLGPGYVSGFGRVQSIELLSCDPAPCDMEELFARILGLLRIAYFILHRSFVERVCATNERVLDPVYRFFASHLAARNKRHLFGRYWFIVANDDFVLYMFDETELRRAIERYMDATSNNIVGTSPYETVCSIVKDTFPFKKTLASEALRQRKWLSQPWSRAKYSNDSPLILKSEEILYDSSTYSGYVVCTAAGYFLIIGCSELNQPEIAPEIKLCEETLTKLFSDAVKTWSAYLDLSVAP